MKTIRVELAERSYDILIAAGLRARVGELCHELGLGSRGLLITDETVGPLYGRPVLEGLGAAGFSVESVAIAPGEQAKALATVERLYDEMLRGGLDRKSFVVALGGGVVGDVAGFAAATYMRGIPVVQVPTTVVAQVDSSLGGKTGVNLPQGKNLVGAFHQPRLVVIDPETLYTLEERDLRAGFAEIVKHGVIRDAVHFAWLEAYVAAFLGLDPAALEEAIAESCRIKAAVVALDERESGLRAILNFGHTVGHALESLTGYGAFRHGEAIAIGMACAAELSVAINNAPAADAKRLLALLDRAGLPTAFSGIETRAILEQVRRDKKVEEQRLRMVLLNRIGAVSVASHVDEGALATAIDARRFQTPGPEARPSTAPEGQP
ncbi:MAG: 3-dehydroquinate synthase [Verrucomicrobia bacterium]|nr:3-dehydroquinate synthase [Verrucomicrobiota bacterium]